MTHTFMAFKDSAVSRRLKRNYFNSGGSKGGRRGRAPPWGPKFSQFHAVFGKIWQNRMLAPPWGVGAPSSGKSWIRHCSISTFKHVFICLCNLKIKSLFPSRKLKKYFLKCEFRPIEVDVKCYKCTGWERLIRCHSSARFCFELSGDSN